MKGQFKEKLKSVGDSIRDDIVKPMRKDLVYYSISAVASYFLYGDIDKKPASRTTTAASARQSTRGIHIKDTEFPNYGRRKIILEQLYDMVYDNGHVSIEEFYSLLGTKYGESDYGWKNLAGASILKKDNGWVLKMPVATPLR